MKKSLSVVLSTAMAVSVFASAAFAETAPATTTTGTTATATAVKTSADFKDLAGIDAALKAKIDAMLAKGYFEGVSADSFGINENMTRAQFAKILVLVAGVKVDESVKTSSFADVKADDAANSWAIPFIEAAKKAGLVDGKSNTSYDPGAKVTLGELATALVKATGGKVDTTGTPWYADAVKQAVALKVLPEGTDGSKFALRSDLVVSAAGAVEALTKQTAPAVDIKVIGAKKVEVTFNKAVDKTKATVEVKKGSTVANVAKISFNDANTVATVELSAKLTKGDYVISVGGVVDPVVTKTVTIEDEKVSKVEIASDKAPLSRDGANTTVTSKVKVLNQYNEDVTKEQFGNLTLTSSKGVASVNDKGEVTITTTRDAAGNPVTSPTAYTLEEKVSLSVVHPSSGTYATQVLVVSLKAQVASVEITKLNKKDDKTLNTAADKANFWLVLNFKDQYGNAVPFGTAGDRTNIADDVIVSVSNPTVLQAGAFDVKDDKLALTLDYAKDSSPAKFGKGTSSIFIISKTTGNKASIDVEVLDVAKVDTLSLTAPDLAVAGEKVTIPYTLADQFGKDLAKADDINGGLTSISATGVKTYNTATPPAEIAIPIAFEQDWVANKPKLVMDLGTAKVDTATTVFITAVTATGKVAQLSVSVQPNAKPVVVTGIDEVKGAVAVGATTDIKRDKVKVLDQYGRAKKASDFGYSVKVETSNKDKVGITTVTGETYGVINAATTVNTLTGVADGTADITLKLFKDATLASDKYVSGSDYKTTVKVAKLSEITGYEVADVAKLYTSDDMTTDTTPVRKYQKSISVNGLLADGTKVAIPTGDARYYSVFVPADLGYDTVTGKVYATAAAGHKDTGVLGGASKEKTYTIVVTGVAKDGPQLVNKDIVVSNVNPVAEKLEYRDGTVAKKVSDGVVKVTVASLNSKVVTGDAAATTTLQKAFATQIANESIKVTDQYGVELSGVFTQVLYTNFPDGKTMANIEKGTSFNITAITANGKTVTFKVQVVDAL